MRTSTKPEKEPVASNRFIRDILHVCATLGSTATQLRRNLADKSHKVVILHYAWGRPYLTDCSGSLQTLFREQILSIMPILLVVNEGVWFLRRDKFPVVSCDDMAPTTVSSSTAVACDALFTR
jgi:hypothetical protein